MDFQVDCPVCSRPTHIFDLAGEYDGDENGVRWVQFAENHKQLCGCEVSQDQLDDLKEEANELARESEWPEEDGPGPPF